MSSNEDEGGSILQGLKKRRIQRACDICRRKKIRCDGVQMPGNRCSNCIAYNFECTYVETAKKRGPPKGYVESLENRLVKLEKLLRRVCPDESFLQDLDAKLDALDSLPLPTLQSSLQPSHPAPSLLNNPNPHPQHIPRGPTEIATSVIRRAGVQQEHEEDIDEQQLELSENLKRLVVDPGNYRFFGKSSGAMLIQTALELKKEYTGLRGEQDEEGDEGGGGARVVLGEKRKEFWTTRPWEVESINAPTGTYTFPPPDLLHALISLYFTHVNLFYPILHRPTFLSAINANLHLTDDGFGSVVLLACAVGSKYTEDERTKLDGESSMHSSGWRYFNQVQMVKKGLLKPPGLWDLQKHCLVVQFLQSSSAPQSCWTMVGIGIRVAQDVGAHRRKPGKSHPSTPSSQTNGSGSGKEDSGTGLEEWTVEDELWKRAFWCLLCMDRSASAALGRPCAIQDEDFDVDYPLEVDDEYWEHPDPKQRFQQPPGKPSTVTFFNLFLRLHQVLAFTLRTIYSINKSKILLGFVGQQWEQHIVAELDSALNKWVDSVPDHLRWDPNRENLPFFNQSALLYSSYYHIQILIHRPFIPSPSKPSPLSFPSLAICTNAARSCSHVLDICRRRNEIAMPQLQMPSFTAGIVLLLSIWGGKRSGLTTDPKREMADVHKCMQVLRCIERSWHSAGRLWDILYELASVGDLPLPHPSPPVTNKRARDAESPKSSSEGSGNAASVSLDIEPCFDVPRTFAGSKRVQKDDGVGQIGIMPAPASAPLMQQQQRRQSESHSQPHSRRVSLQMDDPLSSASTSTSHYQHQHQHQQQQRGFGLPMYSDELARLPIAGVDSGGPGGGEMWFTAPGPAMHISPGDPMFPHPPNNIPGLMQGFAGSASVDVMYEQNGMGYLHGGPYQGINGVAGYRPTNGAGGGIPSAIHPLHPQHQHQQQQQMRYIQQQQAFVDSDTVAMWSNAPTGFELDEWGSYLSSVSELTQGHPHPHSHPSGHGHMFP